MACAPGSVVVHRDIEHRTFRFACEVAALCALLVNRGAVARQLGRELLDAGTAIGANVEESIAAQSRADFVSKCSIAHKEARETRYWLRLIATADPEMATQAGPLAAEAGELIAILGAMARNARLSTPRR